MHFIATRNNYKYGYENIDWFEKSLLKEFNDFATLSLSCVALIWYWSLCQADKKSWNGERLNYKTEEKWTSDLKHQTEQNLVD